MKTEKSKKLCRLPNGRTIYVGDLVTNTTNNIQSKATGLRAEDGDKYMTFENGTEALAIASSEYWFKYSGGAHIHLK
jgi:hypothetical protein